MTSPPYLLVSTSGVPRERDDIRDRELFGDLAAGKPEVLAELYDRHAASLFRHAVALARRRPDAEDLVHGVFVKLATTRAELREVKSPAAYLHRMLHGAWVDGQRRSIVSERAIDRVAAESIWPRQETEVALDLARALEQLPEPQREVIVLHLVEGFSFREIGSSTGVSLFTAAARYRLGLARLRKILKDETH